MTYDYVIGMDVGKYFHHACVLDIDGAQVLSKRINQNENPCAHSFQISTLVTTRSLSLLTSQITLVD